MADYYYPGKRRPAPRRLIQDGEEIFTRKCHDCGAPTNNYRCNDCWQKKGLTPPHWKSDCLADCSVVNTQASSQIRLGKEK